MFILFYYSLVFILLFAHLLQVFSSFLLPAGQEVWVEERLSVSEKEGRTVRLASALAALLPVLVKAIGFSGGEEGEDRPKR